MSHLFRNPLGLNENVHDEDCSSQDLKEELGLEL